MSKVCRTLSGSYHFLLWFHEFCYPTIHTKKHEKRQLNCTCMYLWPNETSRHTRPSRPKLAVTQWDCGIQLMNICRGRLNKRKQEKETSETNNKKTESEKGQFHNMTEHVGMLILCERKKWEKNEMDFYLYKTRWSIKLCSTFIEISLNKRAVDQWGGENGGIGKHCSKKVKNKKECAYEQNIEEGERCVEAE